jgi:hypothetical protein
MSRAPVHICFYSNNCQWCKAFITEIAQTPYKGEFKYVCVDPGPNRPTLPTWLKKVPTLVISGEQNPRTDSDVMNWLYERKLKETGRNTLITSTAQQVAQGPADPQPFGFAGGNSYNDPYTFLDQDTMAQGNGGLQGSENGFSFLNGAAAHGSKEGGSMNTIEVVGKMSKKEQMFDNQMKNYLSSRDAGMPKGPNRM